MFNSLLFSPLANVAFVLSSCPIVSTPKLLILFITVISVGATTFVALSCVDVSPPLFTVITILLSCVGAFLFSFNSVFNTNIAPSIPSSL